jgi:fluoride exporter
MDGPWTQYVLVFAGGGLGALFRFTLGAWITRRAGAEFPFHTLTINVTGSLVIGALMALFLDRVAIAPGWRLFFVVGFLGGYTTFSSYSFEAITLMAAGEWPKAAWYVIGSNGLSLLACFAGMTFMRFVTAARA